MFNYINSDITAKEGNVVWVCGPYNQISEFIFDNLKKVYLPHMFEEGQYVKSYEDNLIYLDKATTAQQITDISKEPPFLGSHYILQGDLSDLETKVKRRLLKLIEDDKDYVYAFIGISQFRDYIQMSKDPKKEYGDCIYHFRRDERLLANFIRDKTKKDISEKAVKTYIRRTATHDNFILYIEKLKELDSPIAREDISKNIPDCTSYSMLDYFENMLTTQRKTVHMKALNDCLEAHTTWTYSRVLSGLTVLMDLKKLSIAGYLMPANMYGDIEHLKSIRKLPASLRNINVWLLKRYLILVMKLNLSELTYVYLAFLNTRPSAHNLYILTDIAYNRGETYDLIQAIASKDIVL